MLHYDYKGKQIKVRVPTKKVPGEIHHQYIEEFSYITGKCVFSGYNQIIQQYQVTIDRTPIWPVTDEDIEIIKAP